MISSQLIRFSSWFPIDKEGIKNSPKKPGTYVIRVKGGKCFRRLQGETDIIYIGSTVQLRRRFYQYLHPGPTQWTNKRINKFLKKYSLEIAWSENDEPGILEHNLLRQFAEDHDEFPPLNLQDIRKLKKTLQDTIILQ